MFHYECISSSQIFRALFHVVGPEMLLDLLQVQFSGFASVENWADCLKAFHSYFSLALFIRNDPLGV
ncbi:hypothetical protein RchiOBHm_Chr7g0187671 [Rosa chinensis]|uniref:Uncharacterized protein n=1 Tax=Rosa chinensis TaxID=74649 RepID=A0A2P6P496_ROSCH|nr:hypothetical protein RchiOBHm_Chr7g0187671 [Rosa chinensis]